MATGACVQASERGLYCPAGDFYVDPWEPVDRAVVTHAHADHAARGSGRYLTTSAGAAVLRHRFGPEPTIDTSAYGQTLCIGDVRLSLHPAGHLLGSAQVRIEHRGQVCVVSGDYKREPDPTCDVFETVSCDHFVTESTFGLPIFCWPDQDSVLAEINAWWRGNAAAGLNSVVFVYALGKAQRLLAGLDVSIGPILLHGAVDTMTQVYRDSGVRLPLASYASAERLKAERGRAMVLAPPSANGSTWMRRLRPFSSAMASGWMQVRGRRRFRAVDRGFVLSDHADWRGLLQTIRDTGATRISVTHGYAEPLTRYLQEQGYEADALPTRYGIEVEEDAT